MFKKNNRIWIIAGVIVIALSLVGVGVWYFLPEPAEVEKVEDNSLDEDLNPSVDFETAQQLLEDNTTEFMVQELSRCVNFNFNTTEWTSPLFQRNFDLLRPTMIRFRSSQLSAYINQQGETDLERFAQFVSSNDQEILMVIDSNTENLLEELRVAKNLESLGGRISRIEIDSSFPSLYSNQLTQVIDTVQASFPTSQYALRGDYENQTIDDFEFDAVSLPLSVPSQISAYENLDIEFGLSINQPEQTLNRQLGQNFGQKPVWITSFNLDEQLDAQPGERQRYENLQLGGSWAQSIFTSFGYNHIMEEEAKLVCIDSLSASPQNSLYYLETNINNSTYPVLGGKDWELTANGQAFYMLAQASSGATRQYQLDNASDVIKVWIFEDADGNSKGWLLNGDKNTVFVDMADYGFRITDFEMKKAQLDEVILNRSDVTNLGSREYDSTTIQLEPYSITVLGLEKNIPNQAVDPGNEQELQSDSEDTDLSETE